MTTQTRPHNTTKSRKATKTQINSSWTENEREFRSRLAESRQSRFLTLVGLRAGQDRD